MKSILWPIPIVFAIYQAAFYLSNAWMSANKFGTIEDSLKLWYWPIIFAVYVILEIIVQMVAANISTEHS